MPRFRRRRTRRNPYHKSRRFQAGVMRVLNREVETKHHRWTDWSDGVSISNFGILSSWEGGINGLGPNFGDDATRQGGLIGNEADQLGFHMRGVLVQADDYNVVRMVVFTPTTTGCQLARDIQSQVAGKHPSQFMMNTNSGEALYSTLERELVEKKYVDTLINLNGFGNKASRVINKYIKLNSKKLKLQQNPDNSLTQDKPIFILLLSDSTVPTDPSIKLETICYYKDA